MADKKCDCEKSILQLNHYDNEENHLKFYQDHNLLKKPMCSRCGEEPHLRLVKKRWNWCCYRRTQIQEEGNVLVFRCCFQKTVTSGTWFERSKLPLKKIMILVKIYLGNSYDSQQASEILGVSKNTLTDWTNFIREVCTLYRPVSYTHLTLPTILLV